MINWQKRSLIFFAFLCFLLLPVFKVYSGDITVNPGKFDRFIITLPDRIQAGQEVQINIQAADNLGNLIKNFNSYDKEFVVSVAGSATVNRKSIKASSFSNGVATIIFSSTVAEKSILSIRESNNLIPLITKEIVVSPGALKSFALRTPKTSRAGEQFDVYITAKDSFGNTYTETILGKNLNFAFKGEADVKLDMPVVPDIVNGFSKVSFMSMKTGSVVIEVKDVLSGSIGVSDTVEIINGNVNSFKIMAPKEAVAGEPFEVSIAAIDRFGNFVVDYSSNGKGINIKSTGKTIPFPSTVPSYEFNRGQARLTLRYDIAETVVFNVSEIGGTQTGSTEPITVTLPKPERFEIVTPETVVAGQKFKIKITVYNQNNRVIKNYNLIGADVVLKTTGTGVLMPDRIPPSEFVNGTAVVEVQYNKAESFSITADVAESTPKASTETPKKETTAIASTKPPKRQPQQLSTAEHQPTKKGPSKAYEVSNISVVESKQTSTITAHITGMNDAISYSLLSEKGQEGKKYIVLKIKNAISKVEKDLTLESKFFKGISVHEEGKKEGAVLIKIEQIRSTPFKVTKGKGTISVIFSK